MGFTPSVGGPLVATSEFAEGGEDEEEEEEGEEEEEEGEDGEDEGEEAVGGGSDKARANQQSHSPKEVEVLPNATEKHESAPAGNTSKSSSSSNSSDNSSDGISLSYALIAGDLRQLDTLEEALRGAGFDRSLPTLFLAE